jgi:hypothetical protein
MIPKDKAKELVEKFLKQIIELAYAETKTKELAKQCALICVEEILKSHSDWSTEQDEVFDYWEEVKQEIEKL